MNENTLAESQKTIPFKIKYNQIYKTTNEMACLGSSILDAAPLAAAPLLGAELSSPFLGAGLAAPFAAAPFACKIWVFFFVYIFFK